MKEREIFLLRRACDARMQAYAPYSNFHVGCAIEATDGRIVLGANVENACYRLGQCAEQVALGAAQQTFGMDSIARIAIVGGPVETAGGGALITPCGGCRQAIAEAQALCGAPIEIICGNADGSACSRHTLPELLPGAFTLTQR
ncbi:cytidine deaminase [Pacificimonas sp. WHA3]|uniref:Cytidine deaminase n=1 Tax=Pacificimonas pallii TaxID=2827236 RepID=A0ABS6SHB0_9SPHN|nr:cytidine deaminase [Pacificimonas pallii]MBV7257789.1 cytidine deaminase [Pacificimonas pallii]